jgi:hypothetical protein
MKAIGVAAAGFLLGFLPLPVEASEEQVVGNCTTFVERGTLFVVGNEVANDIGIGATVGGSVQVTCGGESATFDRTTALTVQAGDGNDQISADNSNGQLGGIFISVFGEGGNDLGNLFYPILPFVEQSSIYDGGPGDNTLVIVTTPRADQFDVRRGAAADAVEVQVTDIATGMVKGNVVALAIAVTSVKSGADNDIMNLTGRLPTFLSFFGEEGDDEMVLSEVLIEIFPSGVPLLSFVGGIGHDKFIHKGTGASEHYEVAGVRDLTIPDPELRVADMATGLQLARVQFLRVDEVELDTSGGDDVVDVQWNAALMSELSLVQVDLGKGNNKMSVNLLPVLTMPETEGVQRARFNVVSGSGKDQVTFSHSASNWFDVIFTADLGKGNDAFSAELGPPPDDGLPGPDGPRRLQFDVATGSGNDFVAIHNRTTDEFFIANLSADLAGDNDIFEATGIIGLSLLPGPGFDTARVTRNLLQFVTEFESVFLE